MVETTPYVKSSQVAEEHGQLAALASGYVLVFDGARFGLRRCG
jgi:hypothetical protein